MLVKNGEERLKEFTEREYKETVTEVTKGIWHVCSEWDIAMRFSLREILE